MQKGKKKEKRRGFTSIQMLHARTHPAGTESTLKGERKKKADTNDGPRPKQRRWGGDKRTSRTNLHGETDLTNTEHTREPHNTLPRGTGEELGTEWGTSW